MRFENVFPHFHHAELSIIELQVYIGRGEKNKNSDLNDKV